MSVLTINAHFRVVMASNGAISTFENGPTVTSYSAKIILATRYLGQLENGYWEEALGTGFTYSGRIPTGGTVTTYRGFASDPRVGTPAALFTISTRVSMAAMIGNDQLVWSVFLTGADRITGSALDDVLQGLGGNDTLVGSSGQDTLIGGLGDDIVNGGIGNDRLLGGGGKDVFAFSGAGNTDVIVDFVRGQDKINLSALGIRSLSDITMTSVRGTTAITLRNGTQIAVANVSALAASDFVFGTLALRSGTAAANTLTSGVANELLAGGGGNDTYVYNAISGGSDRIADISGGDTLSVTTNEDVNIAAVYRAGASSEMVIAFDNGNTMIVDGQFGASPAIQALQVRFLDPIWGNEADTYYYRAASSGYDLIVASNASGATINALAGDDIVAGSSHDDVLTGGDGFDQLFGNAGNDALYGDGTSTPVDGVDYEDELSGGAGNDRLYGELGGDWLWGHEGSDVLNGGAGWDGADYFSSLSGITVTLTNGNGTVKDGLGGTDTLVAIEAVYGSKFNDTMVFGTGNTANLNFMGSNGNDTLRGTTSNSGEIIRYDDSPAGAVVNLRSTAYNAGGITIAANTARDGWGCTDSLLNIDGAAGSKHDDVLIGNGESFLQGGKGADRIIGAGSDTVGFWNGTRGVRVNIGATVTIGNITLTGGRAIDEFGTTDVITGCADIYATDSADVLVGSTAVNIILANGGDDAIMGGGGADDLTGGLGADVFRYTATTEGSDIIRDFVHGTDKIQLVAANFGNVSAASFYQDGDTLPTNSAYLVYDGGTGILTYDSNGSSVAGGQVTIATLSTKPTLTSSDILFSAS